MEKLKQLLDRLLFPETAVVVLSVPVAAALLVYTFLVAGEDSPIAYLSYLVSAYSLTIVCASAATLCRAGRRWAMQNRYVQRYLQDIPFKTQPLAAPVAGGQSAVCGDERCSRGFSTGPSGLGRWLPTTCSWR